MRPRINIEKKRISEFCRKWKIIELSLFGSVLNENFRPKSDVDVLISLAADAPWSLYEWVDMMEELEEIFGRRVDLVEKAGLRNPYRRREILKNRRVIYAG
jgi:hypothetical protein